MNNESQNKRKPGLLFTLVIQLAGLASLAGWSFTALFAPMFFDGGNHWRVWALFFGTISAPVLVAIAMVALWVAYIKASHRLSIICAAIILLSLLPILGALG